MGRKLKLTKRNLKRFVQENKSTKFIAGYYKVSERTIYRRVVKWNLKGIRPKGRKPLPIVEPIAIPKGWITANRYLSKLNKQYHFRNITFFPKRYVNTNTLVCSNRKRNPRGKYASCTVYYVAFESQLYFLYPNKIGYSAKAVSFNEIYRFMKNKAHDLLTAKMKNTNLEVIEVVAFDFLKNPSNNHYQTRSKETVQSILENNDTKKLRIPKKRKRK